MWSLPLVKDIVFPNCSKIDFIDTKFLGDVECRPHNFWDLIFVSFFRRIHDLLESIFEPFKLASDSIFFICIGDLVLALESERVAIVLLFVMEFTFKKLL